MSNVESEMKAQFDTFATDLYGSKAAAEAGWATIAGAVREQARKERIEAEKAAAERRAEREARTQRGAAQPTVCPSCFMAHSGECF
jgi:hypothetical protein